MFRKVLLMLLLAFVSVGVWAAPGDLDTGFNSGSGANDKVTTISVQPNGKIIVGGVFTSLNEVARNFIAYLNEDGSVDSSFNAGALYMAIHTSIIQAGGKVFVGGEFTSIGGSTINRIARLNSDGSLENTFKPGTGANGLVYTSALQPDGKIIIGGWFNKVNGISRSKIARLNANGSLDETFNPGRGSSSNIYATAVQSDGKIIIGGSFYLFNNISVRSVARLNSDGSLDNSFNSASGADNNITAVLIQTDGKIIIGGSFTSFNGVSINRVARLNSDGTLDESFNPGVGANNFISTMALQADGKIIIGGSFTSFNGIPRNRIARLNSDGSLDISFNPIGGANNEVSAIAIQSDGKVLVGGNFTSFNGASINRIVRIHSGDSDSDGIEDAADKFPFDENEYLDTDADGVGDNFENDDDNDTVLDFSDNCPLATNVDQQDYDGDGEGDICDLDNDNDGDLNIYDEFPLNTAVSLDLDLDGFSESWNIGCDIECQINSGLTLDNCPLIYNIDQLDTDVDGAGDFCDSDDDNDGWVDLGDNCSVSFNPDQLDIDHDAQGDICDPYPYIPRAGSLDQTLNPEDGPNNAVNDTVVQSDGKMVIVGRFTLYNGLQAGHIARINPDGSLDNGFNVGIGSDCDINNILLQRDQKIIIIGCFSLFNGVSTHRGIMRLNSDGTIDNTFTTSLGIDDWVVNAAIQSNGKIIISGDFKESDGSYVFMRRLNFNGSFDNTFNLGGGPNGYIYALAEQDDGKIIIAGDFDQVDGISHIGIARLNIDGSLDNSFNVGGGSNGYVKSISIQDDGKIVAGGDFSYFDGLYKNGIVRLMSDGSIDNNFMAAIFGEVNSTLIQPDGKIIIAGMLAAGDYLNGLARLNSDGTVDSSFDAQVGVSDSYIDSLIVDADGRLIISGDFYQYNYLPTIRIARVNSGDPDGDLVQDAIDAFPLDAYESVDTDSDGIGNNADSDDDNDSVLDINDAFPLNPSESIDTDSDGTGNNTDTDDDNDGILDINDAFPLDPTKSKFVHHDTEADGDSDLLTRSASLGTWTRHTIQNAAITGTGSMNAYTSSSVQYVAQLDANGDGDADILTRNTSTGAWYLHQVQSGAVTGTTPIYLYANLDQQFIGAGDFNGDGTDDVMLRSASGGYYTVFLLANHAVNSTVFYNAWTASSSVPQGVGDFDGDGTDDLLVRRTSDNLYFVFKTTNGGTTNNYCACNIWNNPDWTFQFAGDTNKDGTDDIVIRGTGATGNGQWWNFRMSNFLSTQTTNLNTFSNKSLVSFAASGDYNADGHADMLIRVNNGPVYVARIVNGLVSGSTTLLSNLPADSVVLK